MRLTLPANIEAGVVAPRACEPNDAPAIRNRGAGGRPGGRHQLVRAYVVDDERLAVQRLSRLIAETGRADVAGSTTDPHEALAFLNQHSVDVLFLDIQMPGLTGFELLEQLNRPPTVVFTTAYDAYALDAFEANAVDYLLKPIEIDRLARALDKVARRRRSTAGRRARAGARTRRAAVADAKARAHRVTRRRAHDAARGGARQSFRGEGQAHLRRDRGPRTRNRLHARAARGRFSIDAASSGFIARRL